MYGHDTGSWHYISRVQLSFHGLQETVWQKVHAANVHAFEPRQLSRQTRPSLQVCIVNKSKMVSLVALSAIMLCDAMWCCEGRGSPHSPLLLEVSRTKLQWKPMSGHLNYVTPLIHPMLITSWWQNPISKNRNRTPRTLSNSEAAAASWRSIKA